MCGTFQFKIQVPKSSEQLRASDKRRLWLQSSVLNFALLNKCNTCNIRASTLARQWPHAVCRAWCENVLKAVISRARARSVKAHRHNKTTAQIMRHGVSTLIQVTWGTAMIHKEEDAEEVIALHYCFRRLSLMSSLSCATVFCLCTRMFPSLFPFHSHQKAAFST